MALSFVFLSQASICRAVGRTVAMYLRHGCHLLSERSTDIHRELS